MAIRTRTVNGITLAAGTDEGGWRLSVEVPDDVPMADAAQPVIEFLLEQADVMEYARTLARRDALREALIKELRGRRR